MLALLLPLLLPALTPESGDDSGANTAGSLARVLAPKPRLEVLAGRALSWSETGIEVLLFGSVWSAARSKPTGYVELGPSARLELAWLGLASVQILGPASVEWSLNKDGEPSLFVWRAERIELDVRRGGFSLNYAGRVAVDARRGALSMRETPGGLRFHHHGGAESSLWVREASAGEPHWLRRPLRGGESERVLWTAPQEASESLSP